MWARTARTHAQKERKNKLTNEWMSDNPKQTTVKNHDPLIIIITIGYTFFSSNKIGNLYVSLIRRKEVNSLTVCLHDFNLHFEKRFRLIRHLFSFTCLVVGNYCCWKENRNKKQLQQWQWPSHVQMMEVEVHGKWFIPQLQVDIGNARACPTFKVEKRHDFTFNY